MEQLIRTANKLDVFFKILFILLVAFTAMAAVMIALAFTSDDMGQFVFSMSGITVALPDDALVAANARFALFFGVAMLAASAITGYGIHVIRGILKPMKQAMPFSPSVSQDLKKLGWITLGGGLVYTVFDLVGKNILVNLIAAPAFTTATISVTHRIDGTFIVIAAILFLFSYIFHYGAALQQQADETL